MALASAPSTPEKAGLSPPIRRSFTTPIKSSRSAVPIPEGSVDEAETLYAHNGSKIISFSHSSNVGRRHSSVSNGKADFQDEPTGTLPWASATERTIAAGHLRIYRVLGSVAFLSSGSTLHPILAKSQCWCVDGESKFVLRIRPNSYYRIELPCTTSEDKMKVEELKTVLGRLLQYEATPCPFKRGFTVDLPEMPKTPIQKKPWKPKPKAATTLVNVAGELDGFDFGPDNPTSSPLAVVQDIDQKWIRLPRRMREHDQVSSSPLSSLTSNNDLEGESTDETEVTAQASNDSTSYDALELRTPTRPKFLMNGRAETAPPQLPLGNASPSTTPTDPRAPLDLSQVSPSLSSSMDSFHSFHSPISPLAPSPPFPDLDPLPPSYVEGLDISRTRNHNRDVSEITVTGDHPLWDLSNVRSSEEAASQSSLDTPGTPPLVDDGASESDEHWSEAVTPSPTKELRRRRLQPSVRTESPLPPSVNLCSPYSPQSRMSGHHLTTAILQRTCSILLGPPVQLVALMLRIAAKIARGAYRGSSFGFGESGQKIPCSWDFSDGSDDDDEEDDYGIPISRPTSRSQRPKELAGSWEID